MEKDVEDVEPMEPCSICGEVIFDKSGRLSWFCPECQCPGPGGYCDRCARSLKHQCPVCKSDLAGHEA
jgi:hypothetical protein